MTKFPRVNVASMIVNYVVNICITTDSSAIERTDKL